MSIEEKWPIITEKSRRDKGADGFREFTIKDARNIWEVVIDTRNEKPMITIMGFENFHFFCESKEKLRCFKKNPVRVSDSGELASHADRFNLVDSQGKRKTLRLKNFKKYAYELLRGM